MNRVLLVFVDGLGWGPAADAANPTQTYGGSLLSLPEPPRAGGPVHLESAMGAWARPIDACLGVPGLPQSATGQTALLTGVNAPASLGRHKEGFPGPHLRSLLLEHSLLKRVREGGGRAAFLNAYRPPFFGWPRDRQLRWSATTVANIAAELPFFDVPDIAAGRSVYQEFTGRELRALGYAAPLMSPAFAGRQLARASRNHDFALFEFFQTDRAGHAQSRARAEQVLRRLDGFLSAVLRELARDGTSLTLLCSDHGNIEDLSVPMHTRHPVPLLAWGPGAEAFVGEVARLDEVTPAILRRLAR